jgi:radical SAM protein with 4Fe4S-binding SPASM domain
MEFEPTMDPKRRREVPDYNPAVDSLDLEIEELESRVAFMPVDGGGGSSCASCAATATCRGGCRCP